MKVMLATLGTLGPASLLLLLLILAGLTQRWEAVTRQRSYYSLLYVAAGLVGVSLLTRMIRIGYLESEQCSPWLCDPTSLFYLLLYHAPLAVGVTIGAIVTWRNWNWLLKED